MPNRPSTVTAYTDVASAAGPDTLSPAMTISVAPVAIDTKNDQKCSHPRIRGRVAGSGGLGGVATVTGARLRHCRFGADDGDHHYRPCAGHHPWELAPSPDRVVRLTCRGKPEIAAAYA